MSDHDFSNKGGEEMLIDFHTHAFAPRIAEKALANLRHNSGNIEPVYDGTADGLRTGDLAVRFGARKLQYFLRQAQKFTAAGTLQVESGRYYIPPTHWFISDSVISDLFLA